jgi:hypothetical protein
MSMARRLYHLQKTNKTRKVEWWVSPFFAPKSRPYAKRVVAKQARRDGRLLIQDAT